LGRRIALKAGGLRMRSPIWSRRVPRVSSSSAACRRGACAISALRAQLPALDRPLLHLRVLSDGERLVVAGDQPYEPLTGQRVMEFPLDELSRKVAELSPVPRPITPDMTIPNDGRTQDGSGRVEVPSTALAWFERGLTAAVAGRHDEAMDAYRAALALDATLAPAHANLGALLAHQGERTEAARHLDTALALDPSAVEARMSRASLHELADEPEHALSMWAALIADAPARPPVRAGYTRTSALVRRRHAL
jgi:tetratricopeptide (TPR) repeat protein